MGGIVNYLWRQSYKNWEILLNLLKTHKIFYSKGDLQFAKNLYLLHKKYPKLQSISISIRKLKSNLSIVELIMEEDEAFWKKRQ